MGVVAISMLLAWTEQHLEIWFRMKSRVSVKTVKKLVTMRDKSERQLKDTTIRLQLLCPCAANTNCYSLRRLKTFGLAMPVLFSNLNSSYIEKKASAHLLSSQVLFLWNFKTTILLQVTPIVKQSLPGMRQQRWIREYRSLFYLLMLRSINKCF